MRVLSAALRRNRGNRALEYFKESLLHTFSGDISGDRYIFALFGDFVNFIDVNNAVFGTFHIFSRCLNQFEQDVLNILTDITGLCERGCIRNRKGHIQNLCERLRNVGLTRTGRAEHQNIALLNFDLGVRIGHDALIVIVDRDREHTLRALLAYDIVVQKGLDFLRTQQINALQCLLRRLVPVKLFAQYLIAKCHALVANVDAVRAGQKFLDMVLCLAAERAAHMFAILIGHASSLLFYTTQ